MGDYEPPEGQLAGSLPIISDETGRRLSEETCEVDSVTQELKYPSSAKIRHLGENIFNSVVDSNPGFARTLQHAIREGIGEYAPNRTRCLEGMAIVLHAFNIESGLNLIKNLERLTEQDYQGVDKVVREALQANRSDRDMLEIILDAPKIPEQQIMLNNVITNIAIVDGGSGRRALRNGTVAMYNVLAEMRPKLYAPKPSTPPMDMPPQPGM